MPNTMIRYTIKHANARNNLNKEEAVDVKVTMMLFNRMNHKVQMRKANNLHECSIVGRPCGCLASVILIEYLVFIVHTTHRVLA